MISEVTNITNPNYKQTYCLSPQEAVKAAHCQSQGNWNTWAYHNDPEPVVPGHYFWFCGDFAARKLSNPLA